MDVICPGVVMCIDEITVKLIKLLSAFVLFRDVM